MRLLRALASGALFAACAAASATTYAPMTDRALASHSDVIVRARVASVRVDGGDAQGRVVPTMVVTLDVLESFKGAPAPRIELRVPGGRGETRAAWVEGTPAFRKDEEIVAFLAPVGADPLSYRLSELGLSKFELVGDEAGRRFAIRSVFGPEADLAVSAREAPSSLRGKAAATPRRDAASFLDSLRALRRGDPMFDAELASPAGAVGLENRPKWSNVGGLEPDGDAYCVDIPCIYRWFWERPPIPGWTRWVVVHGEQTNLVDDEPGCGIDSKCHIAHAVSAWKTVPNVSVGLGDVHVGGPVGSPRFDLGEVEISLDLWEDFDTHGLMWNRPIDCEGGILAYTMVSYPLPAEWASYRGDSYLPLASAVMDARHSVCASGFRARHFGTLMLHELGHAIGLGHSDELVGMHSTSTPAERNAAVMLGYLDSSNLLTPLEPQADDVQAVRYYYGTDLSGAPPAASFRWSPLHPVTGDVVTFTDTSSEAPFSWYWTVADPRNGGTSSRERNLRVGLPAPGTYPVALRAANAFGTGTAELNIDVGTAAGTTCVADALTLCLNGGRFKVSADWTKANGEKGWGTGVSLTPDSGYLWFFDPKNVEVVVKVLDDCAGPSRAFWVFAAGLTNVESNLAVTDTVTGRFRLYTNPQGAPYQPIQDTAAFPCR